jgi:hypothetical protein
MDHEQNQQSDTRMEEITPKPAGEIGTVRFSHHGDSSAHVWHMQQ